MYRSDTANGIYRKLLDLNEPDQIFNFKPLVVVTKILTRETSEPFGQIQDETQLKAEEAVEQLELTGEMVSELESQPEHYEPSLEQRQLDPEGAEVSNMTTEEEEKIQEELKQKELLEIELETSAAVYLQRRFRDTLPENQNIHDNKSATWVEFMNCSNRGDYVVRGCLVDLVNGIKAQIARIKLAKDLLKEANKNLWEGTDSNRLRDSQTRTK